MPSVFGEPSASFRLSRPHMWFKSDCRSRTHRNSSDTSSRGSVHDAPRHLLITHPPHRFFPRDAAGRVCGRDAAARVTGGGPGGLACARPLQPVCGGLVGVCCVYTTSYQSSDYNLCLLLALSKQPSLLEVGVSNRSWISFVMNGSVLDCGKIHFSFFAFRKNGSFFSLLKILHKNRPYVRSIPVLGGKKRERRQKRKYFIIQEI